MRCRLATSVAKPETQVVTHLCYSDFEDILPAIDGLKGAPPQTPKLGSTTAV